MAKRANAEIPEAKASQNVSEAKVSRSDGLQAAAATMKVILAAAKDAA